MHARPGGADPGLCSRPMPPVDGYTAEDLDRIPDLPPRTELFDGSLALVGPRKRVHTLTLDVLVAGLRRAPRRPARTPGDDGGPRPRQRPEPDVPVVYAAAEAGPAWSETAGLPADVRLAVEVVSRESEERDRRRKPLRYAEARIAHFWRIDAGPDMHTYELDPVTGAYFLTGIHHERLAVAAPFAVDIDLTGVDRI